MRTQLLFTDTESAQSLNLLSHQPSQIHSQLTKILLDRVQYSSPPYKKHHNANDKSPFNFDVDWPTTSSSTDLRGGTHHRYDSESTLPRYPLTRLPPYRKSKELDMVSVTDYSDGGTSVCDDSTLRDWEERSVSDWSDETLRP